MCTLKEPPQVDTNEQEPEVPENQYVNGVNIAQACEKCEEFGRNLVDSRFNGSPTLLCDVHFKEDGYDLPENEKYFQGNFFDPREL